MQLRRIVVFGSVLLLGANALDAHTKRGDKLFKTAEKAEADKDYDRALDFYDQALATDTREPAYLMPEQRMRVKVAQWHIEQGRKLQKQQKFNDALIDFQKAILADPSSQVALQEIRSTTLMAKEQQRAAPGTVVYTPAEKARQDLERRLNSLEGPPELRPINQMIRSLKMNNQPVHVLYESLGKLAGINVLMDPQGVEAVAGKNFNLDLNNVTLEEALNYIGLETHTFWKPISRNAIFVTQESEPKRQEYQDEMVRVFYVQNAATQAEFTEIFNAVRTGAKLTQGIFQVASQNAIVARGTPDSIAILEKLIHDLDKPKPEVVVDIVIMEVNKIKTSTIGAALLGQGGLSVPVNFNPRNIITLGGGGSGTGTGGTISGGTTTITGGTETTGSNGVITVTGGTISNTGGTTTGVSGLTTGTGSTTSGVSNTGSLDQTTGGTSGASAAFTKISQLGHLSTADFAVSLPNTLLQAIMSDSTSRILQRPQLRCTDGGKASLKIGEKIPYVSGSLNSAVATPGSVPYATTQFQQVDVGVNIDLQPHVNGPEDISMLIKVEISNTNQSQSIGGIQEPIITQRVNEATIRMKDGEVGLLGGVSDVHDDNTLSGFPGLTNFPVLSYLFGSHVKNRSDDEVLIALIPHIVRGQDYSTMAEPGILSGTEHVIRVQRKTDGTLEPLDGPAPAASSTPSMSGAAVPVGETQAQPTAPLNGQLPNGQPMKGQSPNGQPFPAPNGQPVPTPPGTLQQQRMRAFPRNPYGQAPPPPTADQPAPEDQQPELPQQGDQPPPQF